MRGIPDTIKAAFPAASTASDANTRFLEYSYFASRSDDGLPSAYACIDAIANTLFFDTLLLDQQIKRTVKTEPQGADVTIYHVGHSLGGVIVNLPQYRRTSATGGELARSETVEE